MPSLKLDPGENFANLVLNVTFTGGLPKDKVAASYAKNFVRLTEAAVQQYIDAQYGFSQLFQRGGSPVFALPQVVTHMEQCIAALRRALRYAHHREGVRLQRGIVNSPAVLKAVTNIRNAIEHTDSKLMKGEIGEGDPIMLKIKSDRMELADSTIMYADLAAWLKNLHELAGQVALYNPDE